MRKYLLGFTIFLVGFISVSFVSGQNLPDSDEYSVYSDLLKTEFTGQGIKQLVIKKETTVEDFSDEEITTEGLNGSLQTLNKETTDDFISRNKYISTLTDKFNLQIKVNLVGSEIDKIFSESSERGTNKDGWTIFRKKYPNAGGIITFSRVGFNKEKTQALIFAAFGCGWLCGEGNYFLLEKSEGNWKVKSKQMTWIS